MSIKDELKEGSDWLQEQHGKPAGWNVPEGYFEGLEARVWERLELEGARRSAPTAQKRSLWQKSYWWAAAASLLALVSALWLFHSPKPTEQTETVDTYMIDTLPVEMAEAYVTENADELAEEELASLLEEGAYTAPSTTADTSQTPTDTPKTAPAMDHPLEDIINDMTDEELEEIIL